MLKPPADDWRSYLIEYGREYVATANEYVRPGLTARQVETGWMGREPASEQTIEAAEQRLGVQLPASLRAFLAVTDGWQGVGGWIEKIWDCENIQWLHQTDTGVDYIELYQEVDDPDSDDVAADMVSLFQRSLLIAEGEDLWLLDPASAGTDGEWAAHEFAPKYGEVEEHESFTALFVASRKVMTLS